MTNRAEGRKKNNPSKIRRGVSWRSPVNPTQAKLKLELWGKCEARKYPPYYVPYYKVLRFHVHSSVFFLAYPHVRDLSTIEWGFPMVLHVARLGPQASVLEKLRGDRIYGIISRQITFTITIHKRGYHWT